MKEAYRREVESVRFTAVDAVTWNSEEEIADLVGSGSSATCRTLPAAVRRQRVGATAPSRRSARLVAREPCDRAARRTSASARPTTSASAPPETEVVALLNPDALVRSTTRCARSAQLAAARARRCSRPRPAQRATASLQISARPALGELGVGARRRSWPGALHAAAHPQALRAVAVRRAAPSRLADSGACLVARRDLLARARPLRRAPACSTARTGTSACARWQAGVPSISAADVARVVHLGGRSGSQAFDDVGRAAQDRGAVVGRRTSGSAASSGFADSRACRSSSTPRAGSSGALGVATRGLRVAAWPRLRQVARGVQTRAAGRRCPTSARDWTAAPLMSRHSATADPPASTHVPRLAALRPR